MQGIPFYICHCIIIYRFLFRLHNICNIFNVRQCSVKSCKIKLLSKVT